MSFILGFSFIMLLALFTIILWLVSKKLPKEFALSTIIFMMMGDAILVGIWYYGLLEVAESVKHFKLGISGAFCFSALGRSIYFLTQNEKNLKNMSYNIIHKDDNAYEILRSIPITYFKNKNESINQQVLGLWVNYLGGDHVLQKENYFLICKT